MKWQAKIVAGLAAALFVSLGAEQVSAQRRAYNQQPGTTIQLPQFDVNTVTTTVTAPDRGTVLLGGIKSLRESRSENGVPVLGKLPYVGRGFRNTGIGREVSSGMMTVTPYIHDFEAMERELLGSSPRRATTAARSRNAADRHAQVAGEQAREAAREQFAQVERPPANAVADEAAEQRAREAVEQAEAELYFVKARTAYREGKPGTARVYLRMAAETATGQLRERVLYAQNILEPKNDEALAGR